MATSSDCAAMARPVGAGNAAHAAERVGSNFGWWGVGSVGHVGVDLGDHHGQSRAGFYLRRVVDTTSAFSPVASQAGAVLLTDRRFPPRAWRLPPLAGVFKRVCFGRAAQHGGGPTRQWKASTGECWAGAHPTRRTRSSPVAADPLRVDDTPPAAAWI
jgi:hypothetical protein